MGTALRVVLDTNVIVSGLAYPRSVPGLILAAWRHGGIEVVLSGFILEESRRLLRQLAHRHGLSVAEVDDLVDTLSIQAELVDTPAQVEPALRDPDDLPILATLLGAQAGGPTFLITGDKDLLALEGRYPVMTPARFWAAHG